MTGDDVTQPNDPIQLLRDNNPFPTRTPAPEVSSRLWARIESRISEATVSEAPRMGFLRSWMVPAGGLVTAAAVIAIAVGVALGRPASTGPSVPILGSNSGTCLEAYSPENLPRRQFAFDGTVTVIEPATDVDVGFDVTFDVHHTYIGNETSTLTVSFPADTGGDAAAAGPAGGGAAGDTTVSDTAPPVSVGDRLLVSGDDGAAWTCGFTRTWSQEMADEWEAATH